MIYKKVYCENCNAEFWVEENVYFCPDCASALTETGERASRDEPDKSKKEKPEKQKRIPNSSPKKVKPYKAKRKLSAIDAAEECAIILACVGGISSALFLIIIYVYEGVDVSLLLLSPVIIGIGAGIGWLLHIFPHPNPFDSTYQEQNTKKMKLLERNKQKRNRYKGGGLRIAAQTPKAK